MDNKLAIYNQYDLLLDFFEFMESYKRYKQEEELKTYRELVIEKELEIEYL